MPWDFQVIFGLTTQYSCQIMSNSIRMILSSRFLWLKDKKTSNNKTLLDPLNNSLAETQIKHHKHNLNHWINSNIWTFNKTQPKRISTHNNSMIRTYKALICLLPMLSHPKIIKRNHQLHIQSCSHSNSKIYLLPTEFHKLNHHLCTNPNRFQLPTMNPDS